MDIQRKEIGPRLSEAVIHQKTIYLAGQVADAGCSPDVYEQTRQVLANIDRLLALSGSDKSRLLSVTIWLTDMDSFGEMNRAWATVHSARLAGPEYGVEIKVIAAQA